MITISVDAPPGTVFAVQDGTGAWTEPTITDMEAEVARGMDLAIVGLGANGHIGTNEPPSSPDSRSRLVELAPSTAAGALSYGADEAPSHALTMGIGAMTDAQIDDFYAKMVKAGVIEDGLDYKSAYTLEFANTGVALAVKKKLTGE